MAIKSFVFILLALSVISYFIPLDKIEKVQESEEQAQLIFSKATMYTFDTKSMNRIIDAQKAMKFDNRDEIYNGVLVSRSKSSNKKNITDTLLSDKIIKRGNEFEFLDNVEFIRDNYISLKTNQLIYDSKSKIATNYLPFVGTYFNNIIKGEKIYLDMNTYQFRASNTHFEIEMKKEN